MRSSVVVLIQHLPAVTLLLRVHGNTPVEQKALARRRDIDDRLAEMVRAAAGRRACLRDDLDPLLTSRLLFGMVNSMTEWVRAPASTQPRWPTRGHPGLRRPHQARLTTTGERRCDASSRGGSTRLRPRNWAMTSPSAGSSARTVTS